MNSASIWQIISKHMQSKQHGKEVDENLRIKHVRLPDPETYKYRSADPAVSPRV